MKTDPRLMASLRPGCYLVQAPCPTSPVMTASITPSMTTFSSNATTTSGMASTTATMMASPTTALTGMLISMSTITDDNNEFSMYDTVADNSSLVYEETTPVYDADNMTIAEWVTAESPSLGDNTTLPRPRETSTLNALGNGTDLSDEVSTLDGLYAMNDSETEKETSSSRVVAETFEENEASDFTSLKPSLDKIETFTLAPEMRRGMEHSALLDLIRAMPGTPVRFNPTLIRYLSMDDGVNWDDEDRRENSFGRDDSTSDRITKREAVMPYTLKFMHGQNVQRTEQEVHSKAQEVQDTDQEFLGRAHEAQSKGREVKGKDQVVRGKDEVHGNGQEVRGTDHLFLSRDHVAQNKDQEIRSKSENAQSKRQKNHNMVQKIPDKNQLIRGKGRVKRVVSYSDYEAMSINDLLDSPKDRNEIYNVIGNSTLKPNLKEETSTLELSNKTLGKEENSDGTLTEIDEAKHNIFTTPKVFYTFTTRDQKEEKGSVSKVPPDQNGLTAKPLMGYATWMEAMSETEEDPRNSTEESDVADEDGECYIITCKGKILSDILVVKAKNPAATWNIMLDLITDF